MSDTLICPKCNYEIEVSAALTALAQRELEAAQQRMASEVDARVAEARRQVLAEATAKAEESIAVDLKDLQAQLDEAKTKLNDAQKSELELRKERRLWEQQKSELELTVNRTIDEERAQIRDTAKREALEEHHLREADKEKMIADLRKQIGDLKRKSEQGPQWIQGEVLEMELETILRQTFPTDTIEPVPVSKAGGDVLQHVHETSGHLCGTILWEVKRTKNWSDAWVTKLRNDQIAAQAPIAVILSEQLPKDVRHSGIIDGIWVTDRVGVLGLATALRAGLLEVARVQRSLVDRKNKEDFVYRYVSSAAFRQRVQGIVQTLAAMKHDLESEKRSFVRMWAKRDKQLSRAVTGIVHLYGDLDGIIGGTLPEIPELELAQIGVEMANGKLPAIEDGNGCPF